jgi:UDP-2,3-diacylglucosamine pyrophosphatase LpxH
MKRLIFFLIFIIQITLVSGQVDFSFVFLPDIHLRPDSTTEANFDLLIKQINNLRPDFIVTGGDMIYTAKNVDEKKAKVMFDFMESKFHEFNMPVYYTIGNHEIVGVLAESGMEISHPLWGKGMYDKLYGKRYYSFTHSGWKFFLLDGIKILEKERNYTQGVDSLQIEWLKNELLLTDKSTPLIISIHTPLINPHAINNSQSQLLSGNSETVLNLFKDHNLKIVLEGHTHLYMNLLFEGIHYISGGSTSYTSDIINNNDGFVLIKIKNNTEDIQFIPTARQAPKYN